MSKHCILLSFSWYFSFYRNQFFNCKIWKFLKFSQLMQWFLKKTYLWTVSNCAKKHGDRQEASAIYWMLNVSFCWTFSLLKFKIVWSRELRPCFNYAQFNQFARINAWYLRCFKLSSQIHASTNFSFTDKHLQPAPDHPSIIIHTQSICIKHSVHPYNRV